MGSEGESIPLEDTEIDQSTSSVVLRRHKASTCTTRRNVAIIDGTLVSSGSNIQAETEQFDLYAEDDSIRTGRIVQVSSSIIHRSMNNHSERCVSIYVTRSAKIRHVRTW